MITPDGTAKLCCKSSPILDENNNKVNVNTTTLSDIFHNNPHIKSIRNQFTEGKMPTECKNCWNMEDAGHISLRQFYAARTYKDSTDPQLRYLDIRLSNKCNLKCIMCDSASSNLIAKEEGIVDHTTNVDVLDQIKLHAPHLREIYFAGGESLLHPQHFEIFNYLVEGGFAKNIRLKYSTNVTVVREEWISMLSKFAKVHINLSVDAVGNRAKYVRYPSKWESIDANIKRFHELLPSNVIITIDTALHNASICGISELVKWIQQYPRIGHHFIRLSSPGFMTTNVLPDSVKLALIAEIKLLQPYPNLKNPDIFKAIINDLQMPCTDLKIEQFKTYIKDKDSVRNVYIADFCPEFTEWFKDEEYD